MKSRTVRPGPGLRLGVVCLMPSALPARSTGEIPTVENPGSPTHGERKVCLNERWRLDGDGEVLLAVITDAIVGEDDSVYLLDEQLAGIVVVVADGRVDRILCREGDGPGEVRSPRCVLELPAGCGSSRLAMRTDCQDPGYSKSTFPTPRAASTSAC